jgi:hypothetical protein
MPKPTTIQLFGASAQVLTSSTSVAATSADPALVIRFSDFASVNWNTVAGTTDPEKWLAAMLLRARGWYATNTDQVPNISIGDPFPGLTTRNNVLKREYSYTVAIYEPDSGAAAPDPDNV